jgi:signal transduction histidine kinase
MTGRLARRGARPTTTDDRSGLALALRGGPRGARPPLISSDKAAWRAAALTRQLLAFSRQQVIAPQVLDLRSVVAGAGSMLARMIGEDIALRTELPDDPCLVEVDQGQLGGCC